jgi:hypothetical protein
MMAIVSLDSPSCEVPCWILLSVVYQDVTRQAKGLHCLKYDWSLWERTCILEPVQFRLVLPHQFWLSIYGWKDIFIELPIALSPWPNDAWVNGNHRIKWMSRICLGATSPSFGLLARVSYWSPLRVCPGVLHVPNDAWVNRNHRIKWTSRIFLGATSPSFGLLARVSYWSPLGVCPGVLHVPKYFIFNRVAHVRVWSFT